MISSSVENYILENVSLGEYYDEFVKPLDNKFAEGSLVSGRTVICPFHTDTDPSLGVITDRFNPKKKIFHCFGCGASGSVIDMHMRVQQKYHGNTITDTDAVRELARLYSLDLSKIAEIEASAPNLAYMRARLAIKNAQSRYTIRTFEEDLLKVRADKDMTIEERANKVNSAIIKMMVTNKDLLM